MFPMLLKAPESPESPESPGPSLEPSAGEINVMMTFHRAGRVTLQTLQKINLPNFCCFDQKIEDKFGGLKITPYICSPV